MTDKERREDDALKNLIQAAYGFSDDELLVDLEEVEATLSDSDFPGIEDRMYRKMMAKLEKEEAAKKTLEKVEGNSLDKTEGEFTNAEVPKRSEIITEIPPIAAAAAPGERVIRFGKKKVVVVGILAAAFVGMLGVTAIGGKNYFFRDREIEMGITVNNDKNLKYTGDLEEVYKELKNKFEFGILMLGYIPEGMKFNNVEILENQAVFTFDYKEKKVYFIQEQQIKEASIGVNSDRMTLDEDITNIWLSKKIKLEEERIENAQMGYAAIVNIDNARYRVFGQLEKEEIIKIAKNLKSYE